MLLELSDVGYGDISPYQQLPAGAYAISMIAAGTDDWTKLAISDTVTVRPVTATTVAAYGPNDLAAGAGLHGRPRFARGGQRADPGHPGLHHLHGGRRRDIDRGRASSARREPGPRAAMPRFPRVPPPCA